VDNSWSSRRRGIAASRAPRSWCKAIFAELPSVVICPLTTTLRDDADQFRLEVDPSKRNGLREVSQIAIDKITVVPVAKIGDVIGEAGYALLLRVNRALALFLGIV
jgi:mRNA interferase MazF